MFVKRHESGAEAKDYCLEAISGVGEGVPWMVCCWRLENGSLKLSRTTWDFPMESFDAAMKLLAEDVRSERERALVVDEDRVLPLPRHRGDGEAGT